MTSTSVTRYPGNESSVHRVKSLRQALDFRNWYRSGSRNLLSLSSTVKK